MYYYYDSAYIIVLIITMVLGFGTQAHINSMYKKWSKVQGSFGTTGAQVAKRMLDANGARTVGITPVSGHLTDYYDPRDNNLHLSDENMHAGSVASVAVACHEAGHAVQHEQGYFPMKFRAALVPVVNFTQQTWGLLFMIGLVFGAMGFVRLAIALYAFSVIFQLVTLPVEIDASRRAVRYLRSAGTGVDEKGARQVLTAAALTYVAAALTSIIQLLYLLSRTRRD